MTCNDDSSYDSDNNPCLKMPENGFSPTSIPVQGPNRRSYRHTGIYGPEKTRVLAYFTQ